MKVVVAKWNDILSNTTYQVQSKKLRKEKRN